MGFDNDQAAIIHHPSGHAIVLAGAGAGKTTCVVERAALLIRKGLNPKNILMLTFTNKACQEMSDRLKRRLDGEGALPSILTFHKFGHRLIRRYPEAHGRHPNPSLMDDKETQSKLRELMKGLGFRETDDFNRAESLYSTLRNEGHTPYPSCRAITDKIISADRQWTLVEKKMIREVFESYEAWKAQQNLLDFDDLIALPIVALQNPENIRLQQTIRDHLVDITVDESQDNNMAQYKLLSLISGPTVIMIGDDDQSIHRWRGACPDNMKQFIRDYNPKEFRLERNYRSTPNIVDSATTLIRHNTDRLEKNPYAVMTQEKPIILEEHSDFESLAEFIAIDIDDSIRLHGRSPKEFAILYRTNRMSRVLESELLKRGIPYQVKRGMDLMHRTEAQILMAFARCVVNPGDQPAFKRLAQITPGIGPRLIEALFERDPRNPLDAATTLKPSKSRDTLMSLRDDLESLRAADPRELGGFVLAHPYFQAWLEKEVDKVAKSILKRRGIDSEELKKEIQGLEKEKRMDTVCYIDDTIRYRLDLNPEDIQDPWADILDLLITPPDETPGEADKVMLSTIHSAKGLQWNVVHVAGMSEGVLPLYQEGGTISDEELTEERCLAYVAMTRAAEELYLHHPDQIYFPGQGAKYLQPSRFLSEGGLAKKVKVQDTSKRPGTALFGIIGL